MSKPDDIEKKTRKVKNIRMLVKSGLDREYYLIIMFLNLNRLKISVRLK